MIWEETLHHSEHFWDCVCVCVCVSSHRRPDVLVYRCRFSDLPAVLFWSPVHHKHTLAITHTHDHTFTASTHTHTHLNALLTGSYGRVWVLADLGFIDQRWFEISQVALRKRALADLLLVIPFIFKSDHLIIRPEIISPSTVQLRHIRENFIHVLLWLLSSLFSALRWAFETRGREENFFMLWRSARLWK